MAITLRDVNPITSVRADGVRPYNTDEFDASYQRGGLMEAARGWKSAGISEDANAVLTLAAKAYEAGDSTAGQQLEAQGRGLAQRAAAWAPTVNKATDVDGVGSAAEFALGSLGGLRTSIKPMVAGLAGAAAGAIAAPFTGGIINPVTGGFAAATAAGYDSMADENIASAMLDPQARARNSYSDIINTGRLTGAAQAPLEAIVPGGMGAIIAAPVKGAVRQAIKQGVGRHIAGGVVREAGEEALTEAGQDVIGQVGQNSLTGREGIDLGQTLNAAAAGAIPGGAMGLGGRAGQVGRMYAGDALSATADAAMNPGRVIGDAIANAGWKAGELAGERSGKEKARAFEEAILRQSTLDPTMTAQQQSEAVRADMQGRREAATGWVNEVLNDPDASPAEKELATETANRAAAGATNTDELVSAGLGPIAKMRDWASGLVTKIIGEGPAPARRGSAMQVEGTSVERVRTGETRTESFTGPSGAKVKYEVPTGSLERDRFDEAVQPYGEETGVPANDRAMTGQPFVQNRRVTGAPEAKDLGPDFSRMRPDQEKQFRIARLLEVSKAHASGAHDALRTLPMSEIDRLDRAIDSFAKGTGDNKTRALFDQLFGGAEPFEGVLSMYREGKSVSEAPIDPVTNTKFDEEKGVFNEDGEKQNSARLDTSTTWEASHAKSGAYFDLKDEGQRGRFERAKEGMRTKAQTDNASVNVKTVGMIDREVEKLGDSATPEMIEEKKLSIVNDPKYGFPKLEAPKAPPAGNVPAANDYKKRRAQFEVELKRRVRAFNNRFQTLRADAESLDRGGMDFNTADVRDVQNNTDLRDVSKASPVTGTLVMERADADGPFVTSAPKLLGRMFKLGNEKDSTADLNRTENLMNLLSQGIASLTDYSARGKQALTDFAGRQQRGEVMDDEIAPKGPDIDFTGRIGYVKYGKTHWVKDLSELPDEFLISGKGDQRITMGDVRNAMAARDAKRAEGGEALSKQLRDVAPNLSEEARAEVLQAVKEYARTKSTGSVDAMRALQRKHIRGVFGDQQGKVERDDIVPSEVDQPVADMQVDLAPAETGLLAYGNTGPEATIRRDSRGFPASGDMAGYGVVGPGSTPASKGRSRGEDNQAPATKALPESARAKTTRTPYHLDWVADRVRQGVPAIQAAIKKATDEQLTKIREALGRISKMKPKAVIDSFDPELTTEQAETIISRAEKVLAGMSDAVSGGGKGSGSAVGDQVDRQDGASGEARSGDNRDPGAARGEESRGGPEAANSDRPVAEAAQRSDAGAVAGGSATADAVERWITAAVKASTKALQAQIAKMDAKQINKALDAIEAKAGDLTVDVTGFSRVESELIDALSLLEEAGETKGNAQSAQSAGPKPADAKQAAADNREAIAEVKRLLGQDFAVKMANKLKGPNGEAWSGAWVDNAIEISVRALDKVGVGRHEAFHQLFQWLRANGAPETIRIIENITQNKLILEKLKKELADHPGAMAQLSDPEEAAAYLFQFWMADKITVGPKLNSLLNWALDLIDRMQLAIRDRVFGDAQASDARQLRKQEALANKILANFGSGQLADGDARLAVIQRLEAEAKTVAARRANTKLIGGKLGEFMQKAFHTAGSIFEDSANPVVQQLGKQFFLFEGQAQDTQPFIESYAQENDKRQVQLENVLKKYSPETLELAHQYMNERRKLADIHHPEAKAAVGEVRALLKEMFAYSQKRKVARWVPGENGAPGEWVSMAEIKDDYYPRVWDISLLQTAKGQADFLAKMVPALEKYRAAGGYAEITGEFHADAMAKAILNRLINGQGSEEVQESGVDLGITPYMAAVNKRELNWLDDVAPREFAEFFSKDMTHTLTTYIAQTVKRGEYTKAFGNGGENMRDEIMRAMVFEMGGAALLRDLDPAMARATKDWRKTYAAAKAAGAELPAKPTYLSVAHEMLRQQGKTGAETIKLQEQAAKALEPVTMAVMAMEGTLGHKIDPRARQVMSAVTTYQNFRLLTLALFSSINDPVGMVVRGGTMTDAWQGFVRGLREIKMMWKKEYSSDELAKLAESMGIVSRTNLIDAIGQTYSSQFMHGRLKAWNDWLFRMNGLEAWNRAMRIQATGAAMNFIKRHVEKPNEHSARYLEELFGKDHEKIDIMVGGELDTSNDKVREAIFRWVNGAILRPNASLRPVYASDPHYMLFYHLKQFAYAFHKTTLRRAWIEGKAGNLAPGAALMVGYVPVAIAADVVKEVLLPDDDPPWMKAGLGGYVEHGVARAALGGVPQMWLGGVAENPLALYSDDAKRDRWMANLTNVAGPAPDQLADLFLGVPLTEAKTLEKELLGALPGGTIARRAVD